MGDGSATARKRLVTPFLTDSFLNLCQVGISTDVEELALIEYAASLLTGAAELGPVGIVAGLSYVFLAFWSSETMRRTFCDQIIFRQSIAARVWCLTGVVVG
jgi:hypothetical protein